MLINSIYADNIIKTALLEDINYLDTTTDYLIDEEQEDTAKFHCATIAPATTADAIVALAFCIAITSPPSQPPTISRPTISSLGYSRM